MEINEIKARYSFAHAWTDLGLPGKPGRCIPSPLRQDRHPSFSVWNAPNGIERFKDHATGASGDVIEFLMLVRGIDLRRAIQFIEERLEGVAKQTRQVRAAPSPVKLPPLRPGTEAEARDLCRLRGFGRAGIRLAEQRGFLWFTELWGQRAWAIADQRRQMVEFRRVDGAMWPGYGALRERKAHCLGSGKRWPIGTLESGPYPKIALVEGAPDLLAACHFLVVEAKVESVAPVAILGAANHHLDPEALDHFQGKEVCVFPHVDDAGRAACKAWAIAMKKAGAARVEAFDLSGMTLHDGSQGKDLADLCLMDVDTWEGHRKFREVMP